MSTGRIALLVQGRTCVNFATGVFPQLVHRRLFRSYSPQRNGSKEDKSSAVDNDPLGSQSRLNARKEYYESFESISKDLPSAMNRNQPQMYKWFGEKMDQLQAGMLTAGKTLNEVTGYKAIEQLKLSIEKLESDVAAARAEVREAKRMYSDAISERSNSQREINELLQRKHNWSPGDLERFTELYRNDHANEHTVADAKTRLEECEHHVEDLTLQLSKQILTRYHEEQIWSDKIRRASTWGTWFLMGFNVLLFIVVQLGLEPWKRRRLVGSFEDKVRLSLEEWEAKRQDSDIQPMMEAQVPERSEEVIDETKGQDEGVEVTTGTNLVTQATEESHATQVTQVTQATTKVTQETPTEEPQHQEIESTQTPIQETTPTTPVTPITPHPLVHSEANPEATYTASRVQNHPLEIKPTSPPHFLLQNWNAFTWCAKSTVNTVADTLQSTYDTAVQKPSESTIVASIGALCGAMITFLYVK